MESMRVRITEIHGKARLSVMGAVWLTPLLLIRPAAGERITCNYKQPPLTKASDWKPCHVIRGHLVTDSWAESGGVIFGRLCRCRDFEAFSLIHRVGKSMLAKICHARLTD